MLESLDINQIATSYFSSHIGKKFKDIQNETVIFFKELYPEYKVHCFQSADGSGEIVVFFYKDDNYYIRMVWSTSSFSLTKTIIAEPDQNYYDGYAFRS